MGKNKNKIILKQEEYFCYQGPPNLIKEPTIHPNIYFDAALQTFRPLYLDLSVEHI